MSEAPIITTQELSPDVKPIRRAMAVFTEGSAIRGRQGNVFLFPDRIAHVSSFGAVAAFGMLGLLISRGRAEGRARKGGHGVETIMLRDIVAVKPARYGLSGGMTEIDTRAGGHFRVGVKYHKWAQDLRGAVSALGQPVSDAGEGFQVGGGSPA